MLLRRLIQALKCTYRILKGYKAEASRAARFAIKHDNRINERTKLFEELLELHFGDYGTRNG